MTSNQPRISVVMAVYNAGPMLRPAVESILGQTLSDLELIIVNDGSTDGSGRTLAELAQQDGRITIVEQVNAGLSQALNVGIAASSADVVALMDSDDRSHPDRLRLQIEMLDRDPGLAAIGCGIRIVDVEGQVRRLDPIERWDRRSVEPHHSRFGLAGPTMMLRRSSLREVEGYRSALTYANDYDLIVRCIDAGLRLDNHPERLYDYTVHGGQMTNVTGAEQRLAVVAADLSREIRRRGFDDPFDGSGSLSEVCTVGASRQDLPEGVRRRLRVIAELSGFLQRHRRAVAGCDPGEEPSLADLRKALDRRAWRSDILAGVHRTRYHDARARRRWLEAVSAGIDLWSARRKPPTSPDDAFLPRGRRTAAP
jgi:glycosyltransferase involved in cell wall biosynthesis